MSVDLVAEVMDIDGWQPRAACRGYHPDADWFPDQHQAFAPRTQEAKRICAGCPVRVECAMYALMMDEYRSFGIFGLTAHQREKLRGVMHRLGFPVALRSCDWCGDRYPAPPRSPSLFCSDECEASARRCRQRGADGRELRARVAPSGRLAGRLRT